LEPIEVTLSADGAVRLEQALIDRSELEPRLTELRATDGQRRLLLKADAGLPYVAVRDTFAALQRLGYPGLSLKVTEKKPTVSDHD
ncbi:MAG: biopolymer transporter ExbD, partial [Polyangiaceae bacterium]|nr:biopolymer transporter ExbD [Polyangiaceae bacterium]